MIEFPEVKSGEWVQPVRRGYLMQCCDCGLVHRLNFRLVSYAKGTKHKIQMQAFREPRAFAQQHTIEPLTEEQAQQLVQAGNFRTDEPTIR